MTHEEFNKIEIGDILIVHNRGPWTYFIVEDSKHITTFTNVTESKYFGKFFNSIVTMEFSGYITNYENVDGIFRINFERI